MLVQGHVEEEWEQTTPSMIPKSGDFTNLGNWRQLAILDITYKFFPSWFKNVCSQHWKVSNPTTKLGVVLLLLWVMFWRSSKVCVFEVYGMVGPDVVCKFGFAKSF